MPLLYLDILLSSLRILYFSPFQQSARAPFRLANGGWRRPSSELFDFESLSLLVTKAGFQVAERGTSFPMELFLLMGLDYTKNPELGLPARIKGSASTWDWKIQGSRKPAAPSTARWRRPESAAKPSSSPSRRNGFNRQSP